MDTQASQENILFQPLDLQNQVVLGQINDLIRKRYFSQAAALVEEHLSDQSSHLEFLLVAAQVYKESHDSLKESQCLHKLIRLDSSPQYMIMLSEALTRLEDYPSALKTLHELIDNLDDKDPSLFDVYKNMGNIYLKCGDIDAAEEKYNLANAINSCDENLLVNYGVLAIQKGDYDQAKERFSQVLNSNKKSDLAWVGLALVHRAYSDHDLARACLLRGLDENPYNKLAITHFYEWCQQDGVDATDDIITSFIAEYPEDQDMNKVLQGMRQ